MKKIIMGVLLIFCLFVAPVNANAAAEATIITANPGEDSSSMMNISWMMDVSKTNGRAVYTKKSDADWTNATTVYGDKKLVSIFHERELYHYFVELTELDSNTEYMYRVGQDTLSEVYYFKTGGSEDFNFVWISDWHSYAPLPTRTDKSAAVIRNAMIIEPDIDFIFSTGDDLAYGSDIEAQEYLYNKPQYKSHMFATTIGNHDVMHVVNGEYLPITDDFFINTHHHPQNGYAEQVGASYYFKYGSALFVVLNNENINSGFASKAIGLAKAKAWAKEVIDNNPAQYIIVAMHYQWFNGRNGATNAQYSDWRTFFDENNVDLAMAGNNHVYLRTKGRIYNNEATNTNKGTVYMQAPSSDGERGVQHGDIVNNGHIIDEVWSQGTYTIGAIVVNVTSDGISHKLVDNNGAIRASGSFESRYKDYEFDKEAFLNGIEVFNVDDEVFINQDKEAIKFVDRIEYYNEETLVGVNYFYQTKDAHYKLESGHSNLKVKVKFTDGTTGEVNLYSDDYYDLGNLSITPDGDDLKLTWDYKKDDDFLLYLYADDEFVKEVNAKDESVTLQGFDIDTLFSFKPTLDSLKSFYNVKYNIMGDGNLDEEVSINDAHLILDYLSDKVNLTERQKYLLDVNDDGIVSILDLTYLHLYTNNKIDFLTKKTYDVSFYDIDGVLIETLKVTGGADVKPPNYELSGDYIFVAWDKYLNNISADLIVRLVVVKG